jgi:DnaJ family protein C protein 28
MSVKMESTKGARSWESWIDQQIREAREKGEFDDLPGKGKPLDLTPNPFAKDQELAFKILRDAGYAPEWIELDKAVRSRLERARTALARSWAWHQDRLQQVSDQTDSWSTAERARSLGSWRQAVASFEKEIAAINAQIQDLNLKMPSPRFHRLRVDADGEIRRLEDGAG